MATVFRVVLLTMLMATVAKAQDVGQYCDSKTWGSTTGKPYPIKMISLESNVFDFDVTVNNPCRRAKVGLKAVVCDPDSQPSLTIHSADSAHVHRLRPIHAATFSGTAYCT